MSDAPTQEQIEAAMQREREAADIQHRATINDLWNAKQLLQTCEASADKHTIKVPPEQLASLVRLVIWLVNTND